jgi:hypothetical protein
VEASELAHRRRARRDAASRGAAADRIQRAPVVSGRLGLSALVVASGAFPQAGRRAPGPSGAAERCTATPDPLTRSSAQHSSMPVCSSRAFSRARPYRSIRSATGERRIPWRCSRRPMGSVAPPEGNSSLGVEAVVASPTSRHAVTPLPTHDAVMPVAHPARLGRPAASRISRTSVR